VTFHSMLSLPQISGRESFDGLVRKLSVYVLMAKFRPMHPMSLHTHSLMHNVMSDFSCLP
jgi:hypothetical protein